MFYVLCFIVYGLCFMFYVFMFYVLEFMFYVLCFMFYVFKTYKLFKIDLILNINNNATKMFFL